MLKVPFVNVSRRAAVCASCLLLVTVICTLATFVMQLRSSTCWTAKDELAMLNRFNALSAELGDGPWPLRTAHSHNDYVQPKPLFEALSAGFCSVEGDVHLVAGNLMIGHMVPGTQTLDELYVEPLAQIAAENKGPIFKRAIRLGTCLQVTLLVDVKSVDRTGTWDALERVLAAAELKYGPLPDGRPIFATYDQWGNNLLPLSTGLPSPIRVVCTGLAADTAGIYELIQSRPTHKSVLDLSDTPAFDHPDRNHTGMISVTWPFAWPPRNPNETATIQASLLARVREARQVPGCVVRYWNTPEDPALWVMLLDAGVDLINTDRIFTLHSFLTGRTGINVLN